MLLYQSCLRSYIPGLEYIGVKFCSLVNSGSSANLLAFMALTSPLLGERRVNRGDEIITVAAGFPTTVTDSIIERTFWIGVYPGMTDESIDYMARMLKEAVK